MLSTQGIEPLPGRRHAAKEVGQLSGRDIEVLGQGPQVTTGCCQRIKRLGQQRRIILVAGRDADSSVLNPPTPAVGWFHPIPLDPVLQCQPQPQPPKGNPAIVGLAPPLTGFGPQTGRQVLKHHGSLNLVAMLPPRPAAPGGRHPALGEEIIGGEFRGVHQVVWGWRLTADRGID